jgi:hypothetical protein
VNGGVGLEMLGRVPVCPCVCGPRPPDSLSRTWNFCRTVRGVFVSPTVSAVCEIRNDDTPRVRHPPRHTQPHIPAQNPQTHLLPRSSNQRPASRRPAVVSPLTSRGVSHHRARRPSAASSPVVSRRHGRACPRARSSSVRHGPQALPQRLQALQGGSPPAHPPIRLVAAPPRARYGHQLEHGITVATHPAHLPTAGWAGAGVWR